MNLEINENYNPMFIPEIFITSKKYKHLKECNLITTDELGVECFRDIKISIIEKLPKIRRCDNE